MNHPQDPYPDGPWWDALRAFAAAEVETQQAHARCFRALATLVAETPPPFADGGPQVRFSVEIMDKMSAACREIADGTDAETAKADDALRRDDRAEVGAMASSCVMGYLRGLRNRPEGKARGL